MKNDTTKQMDPEKLLARIDIWKRTGGLSKMFSKWRYR